jgi:hypothetical protein
MRHVNQFFHVFWSYGSYDTVPPDVDGVDGALWREPGGYMTSLRWIGGPISEAGVTERTFNLEREAGIVPGILWTPTEYEHPVPLVLMGHGGSGHKRADRQLMLGRRFASVSQIAAVAIDGPYHGDRVGETLDRRQYQAMLAAAGVDKVITPPQSGGLDGCEQP